MPCPKFLTVFPMLLLFALAASGCAKPASALQTFPPVELLGSTPKPVPTVEILTSAQAAAAHNIAIETWGQKGWDQVRAVCLWAKVRGMDVNC